MAHAIYLLIDPRNEAVRYVGMTYDVYERFKQHIQCKGVNSEKHAWIQELKAQNLMVLMRVIEHADSFGVALEREQFWIQHYLRQGALLLNIAGVPVLESERQQERQPQPSGFIRYSTARFLSKLYFRDEDGGLLCLSTAPPEKFVAFLGRYVEYDWLSLGSFSSPFSCWHGSGYRCHWINDLRLEGHPLEIYTVSGEQVKDLIGNPFMSRKEA